MFDGCSLVPIPRQFNETNLEPRRKRSKFTNSLACLLPTSSETLMADESDMRRGEDFGGSGEQSEDQEVREEEGEETSSAPRPSSSLQAIEYDPAMLEYDDPLASMKPDVYTDTV